MEPDENRLAALFPDVAAQLRAALSNLHLAAAQLAPAEARENDPALDRKAALLDQSYYRLLRLVNSLSSAAYLTNDDMLTLQDRDIVDLVSGLCEKAGAVAPLLELELRFVCPMERHVCAMAADALEQVVYHLLSNAFKFTPAGGVVTVELQVKNKLVLLSVTDTGRGIPDVNEIVAAFDAERQPATAEGKQHPGHVPSGQIAGAEDAGGQDDTGVQTALRRLQNQSGCHGLTFSVIAEDPVRRESVWFRDRFRCGLLRDRMDRADVDQLGRMIFLTEVKNVLRSLHIDGIDCFARL